MPVIRTEVYIEATPEVCFDLFRDMTLHEQSAGQTRERVISGTKGLIGLGEDVTFEARHFGLRLRLTARITEFEPPHRFVDEMVRGAFREMKHTHEFFPHDGGTLVVDTFAYVSPLGWLGRLADVLFLKRYMRRFLMRRNLYVRSLVHYKKTRAGS
ncbi:SRPBCC family protein [Tumebacillus flagellatus]|uniref:Cell division protein n=1 Tax=Tumebacillus flagellatus TaxID=1157490 RepID=A0A074LQ51_9BACL|nr:SRPBCC family protein [Tumebacillus flagellatus]KEO84271.1 cell division protein [Tumebacillus flagellatus]